MSNNKIKEAVKRAGDRFGKTEAVSIKISLAHLDKLKLEFFSDFKKAIKEEKIKALKPATKAFASIESLDVTELRVLLVEAAVNTYVSYLYRKSLNKTLKRKK